jgi:transposase-like protein
VENMSRIEFLKSAVGDLGVSEVIDLQAFIADRIAKQALDIALEQRSRVLKANICIRCGHEKVVAWGRSRAGTQRFKCRSCGKTFGATNNTPFYRLRKRHLWTRYLSLMGRHLPLATLPEHGIGLSLPSLHRWRHRFLSALVPNPETKLAGMIEADEKFFATSFKGSRGWKRGNRPQDRKARKRGGADQRGLGSQQVPVLTALDRSGTICQARLPDTKWDSITNTGSPWIESDSVICSDGNGAYARLAQLTSCEHIVAKNGGPNTRGLSIGRIDAYHRDVENLINRRCNGVSTRYLMNYFGWARRITQHRPFGNDLLDEMLATD